LNAAVRLDCVAHRVVHGGERFNAAMVIDDAVLHELEQQTYLAPLHNPPALAAVRLARVWRKGLPHIAVFDTAFHRTLPPQAREYALPAELRSRLGLRRFGFHGMSHAHVARAVAHHLDQPVDMLRIVSCHLGNGASATAIERGASVETSMGMTPLEGLVMGTRAGDLDPGVLALLANDRSMGPVALDHMLNAESGLLGLAGTHDMREIETRAADGDTHARLAIEVYTHRVRKYIGAYAATMGGVDAIAFTGGVGENSTLIRARCLERFEFLGASLDARRNHDAMVGAQTSCVDVATDESRVRLLVVRADEALQMALEASAAIGG
jgi:acetate kinase